MTMTRSGKWSWTDDVLPFVAMLLLICLDMAVLTIVKAAMNGGMESIVYVVYHNSLGTLILLPFLVVHMFRNVGRPPLTFHILFRFFILGLFGFIYVSFSRYHPTLVEFMKPSSNGLMVRLWASSQEFKNSKNTRYTLGADREGLEMVILIPMLGHVHDSPSRGNLNRETLICLLVKKPITKWSSGKALDLSSEEVKGNSHLTTYTFAGRPGKGQKRARDTLVRPRI
ncbi:EamA domain, WAT1-related protein [Tanacetum coccineum]